MKIVAVMQFKQYKIRILFNPDYDEYVVKFYKEDVHQANADYFTDDKQDAVDTAKSTMYAWSEGKYDPSISGTKSVNRPQD